MEWQLVTIVSRFQRCIWHSWAENHHIQILIFDQHTHTSQPPPVISCALTHVYPLFPFILYSLVLCIIYYVNIIHSHSHQLASHIIIYNVECFPCHSLRKVAVGYRNVWKVLIFLASMQQVIHTYIMYFCTYIRLNNLASSSLQFLSLGWTATRSDFMFLWHQPYLDTHPPCVQGSRAGLQSNLCLWDTQGQSQGAQRLKDHCLLCIHPCDFCHCPHTHNLDASKPANYPVCSNWNCLPAHSNSTTSNNLCPKGNYILLQLVYCMPSCTIWITTTNMMCLFELSLTILHICIFPSIWVRFWLVLYMYFTNTNSDVLTVQGSQWGS